MFLSRILVYPIKSLDGVSVEKAAVTAGGILEHDRAYAIVDGEGKYVNGKRTPRVQLLRTSFSPDFEEVEIWLTGDAARHRFHLKEPAPLNNWLSAFFDFPVTLTWEGKSGFPDDRTAFGPTVTSEASLATVAGWFPDLDLAGARRRFRSNLELGGVVPFWEDHLFGAPDELKPFQVGEVRFLGHNPCQRCVVPTRDPDRSTAIPLFQKRFMELRQQNLPSWSNPARFNHYYRFAINTSIPGSEAGKSLRVGDILQMSVES
jgi:uncharacterized protein YcbX